MKLIFHHIAKTGGQTIRSLLKSSDCSFLLLNSTMLDKRSTIDDIQSADIIEIHSSQSQTSFRSFLDKNYSELVQDSVIITVVREPIDRLESEWAFAYEKYDFHYPVVPKIKIKSLIESKGLFNDKTLSGYSKQPLENHISINEYFELSMSEYAWEAKHHISDLMKMPANYLSNNPFATKRMPKNRQFNEIYWHFGNSLFEKTQCNTSDSINNQPLNQRIIMNTEILDDVLAYYIFNYPIFKHWFGFKNFNCSDSLLDIKSHINKSRQNVGQKNKSNSLFKLNAKNRILFYNANNLDYRLWSNSLANNIKSIF